MLAGSTGVELENPLCRGAQPVRSRISVCLGTVGFRKRLLALETIQISLHNRG